MAISAALHAQGTKGMKTVDIIIPIYSGYPQTVACVRSVLSAKNIAAQEIIAIYDAGPDPRLLKFLEELATQRFITLLVNPTNLGFVKTVNRGLALHADRDVVLLNSDTQVANDWLDRLLVRAQSDPQIATVTPFSNNAEICSFPNICRSAELPSGWTVAEVDSIFAQHVTPAAIDIPTAVGFCAFIARRALNDVGFFNEALFGRGYGEENDLCRRLAAKHWRNVLCTNVFVYHYGAVSFGEEKVRLVSSAMKVLDRLYPDYHQLVHEFISEDLPQQYRVQAQLALLRADRARILCVTHNLDGGTAKHVRELSRYVSNEAYFFVARMLSGRDLELSTKTDWGELKLYFIWPQQAELFLKFISSLGVLKAHLHHIKNIEFFVQYLLRHSNLTYDVTLHDYYLINGNPALADKNGQFCANMAARDAVCEGHVPVPLDYTAERWRELTGWILRRAQRIFVPSEYAARLFSEYFPSLNLNVLPHPDWEVDAPYPPVRRVELKPGEKFRILVLGALGLEKGADILEQVAQLASKARLPIEFHLLGYAYRELGSAVTVHGAYDDNLLDNRLSAFTPHLVWFPCQWPETYSYTLSACLRGGYPVLAPALGAFIERLNQRPLSWLQEFPSTTNLWLARIWEIREAFFEQRAQEFTWENQPLPSEAAFSYARDYIEPVRYLDAVQQVLPDAQLKLLQQLSLEPPRSASNSRREKVLRGLLRLRQTRLMRILSRLIPFSMQRRIKRSLSPRALHQIARDLL